MSNYYLNFDKQEKGYERVYTSAEFFKSNIGKRIVYITSREVDSNRGYAFPKYGIISKVIRNRVIIGDGSDDVRMWDIIECGIKIEE